MVSGGPIWCWWLLMVVYGPRWLNFVKHLFYIRTAWASKAKMLTSQKHTPENHSPFFIDYGENNLTHIFHIDTNIFIGVEQKFSVFEIQLLYFFSSNVILQHKCWKCQIFLAFSCQILDKSRTCLLSLFTFVLLWWHVPQVACGIALILTARISYSSSSSSPPSPKKRADALSTG